MDRRDALKVMGTGLAAAFMMNIALVRTQQSLKTG